jgi:hypothetical protein
MFEAMWRKLGKIIERLGILIELYTKCSPQGQTMIKFGHDGP